jgi:hypothetical protein
VDIDAAQQRAADLAEEALDDGGRAAALAGGIAIETARAWVQISTAHGTWREMEYVPVHSDRAFKYRRMPRRGRSALLFLTSSCANATAADGHPHTHPQVNTLLRLSIKRCKSLYNDLVSF